MTVPLHHSRSLATKVATLVLLATAAPVTAHAAVWVEALSDQPDLAPGGSYIHQEFAITPAGIKVQALAYTAFIEGQGQAVRVAHRSVPVGVPLEEGDWDFSDARYLPANPPYINHFIRPHLALDRVDATPYVLFSNNQDFAPRLATYVGDGGGDCGEGLDWECDNLEWACGLEPSHLGGLSYGSFRLELESVVGSPADAAHVMLYVYGGADSELVHARKDLNTQTWTCQTVSMPDGGAPGPLLRSVSVFHELDGRLKPQIAYPVGWETRLGHRQVVRSLLDYTGTPLPPLEWTAETTVKSFEPYAYGTPAMAIRDEGLGPHGAAQLTGIGVPALAEIGAHSAGASHHQNCSSSPGTWTMDYRAAHDTAGSSWDAPEPIFAGRPCAPSMAFGWEMNPYVLFHDDALATLMLTSRRPNEPQLWTTPEVIGIDPTWSDIIVDPDLGTVSAVYLEDGQESFTVTDGYLL